ncbi:phosphoribosylaminoimidazole synthetase [Candidatus Hydrogenisulfobacillus filiaventi]|uniref:Phosphoribosylformylglycinamidine cyclo-ligase n=1 Tax=Candidatus Hydrogenisulfobacillus filiaventi TaxID=2707344 RepID=A0A6F8ZHJ6_9FIRM|nr:phosphoribosylformylglycinamidine cyclo-ligase [Bacillota bacterium]CAB1129256.1 phosphoribosylaminoimidazole synthetase [Candidatus Hydrogenisulfobacillus filiaventi]
MEDERRQGWTYRAAGVDIDAGNEAVRRIRALVEATYGPEVEGGIGGFAGRFRLPDGTVLLAGADGVGTKVRVAQALGRHDTVGIDLVAMNVNDVLAAGGEPLFFLDYIACGRLDPALVADLVRGMAAGCREAGCALLGGETAEMPDLYAPGEYDLAGFAVGRERVPFRPPQPGDVVVGLASSGLHSNGYSLARRVLIADAPGRRLEDPLSADDPRPRGEVLLEPTRIYVPVVRRLWEAGVELAGMAHITGGGLVENLPRALGATAGRLGLRLDAGAWPRPPVFGVLAVEGGIAGPEMARTFNLGLGFAVLTAPAAAEAVQAAAAAAGVPAWVVGTVEAGPGVRGL